MDYSEIDDKAEYALGCVYLVINIILGVSVRSNQYPPQLPCLSKYVTSSSKTKDGDSHNAKFEGFKW